MEIVKCECGNESPVNEAQLDKDGTYHCFTCYQQEAEDRAFDFDDDDWEDDDDDDDFWDDPWGECGMTPDGICMLAGTEHCDWDCPHSRE